MTAAEFDELVVRLLLGILAVDARRRSHVEALFALDEVLVVYAHELGFVLILEYRAGRAVRLVADDEVERPERASGLCLLHGGDGLVCRENDGESGRRVLLEFASVGDELRGRCRCREAEVGEGSVVRVFRHFRIGTDGKWRKGLVGLFAPLAERLPKKRDRWDKEQHTTIFRADSLGNLQGCKSFPRAASHDELSTLVLFKAFDDILDGGFLVRADGLLDDSLFHSRKELLPVDGRVLDLGKANARDRYLLVDYRFRCMVRPVVVSGDDDAGRIIRRLPFRGNLLAGGGKKCVNVRLVDLSTWLVAFCLDCDVFAEIGSGDQIDAHIAALGEGTLAPEPHVGKLRSE